MLTKQYAGCNPANLSIAFELLRLLVQSPSFPAQPSAYSTACVFLTRALPRHLNIRGATDLRPRSVYQSNRSLSDPVEIAIKSKEALDRLAIAGDSSAPLPDARVVERSVPAGGGSLRARSALRCLRQWSLACRRAVMAAWVGAASSRRRVFCTRRPAEPQPQRGALARAARRRALALR